MTRVVKTHDKTNPFGVEIEGVVVCKSWSEALMQWLIQDDAFLKQAHVAVDEPLDSD